MSKMKDTKRRSMQLGLTEAAFEKLDEMGRTLDAPRRDVVRYALKWLQWTMEQARAGNRIMVMDDDGNMMEIVAPFIGLRGS